LLPTRSQEGAGTGGQAGGEQEEDDETEAQERIFGFIIRSRRRSLEFIVILDRVREKGEREIN